MGTGNVMAGTGARADQPEIREIHAVDLKAALISGLADFNAKPSHVVFLCILYPLVAIFLARLTFGLDLLPLFFPLLAGFTLIGPLAATGLYEMSRRRELGMDMSWKHAFSILHSPSIMGIAVLGLVLAGLFVSWLAAAQLIYVHIFGAATPESIVQFITQVFTTTEGWRLIITGGSVGFLFAVVVLTISVVSLPMLLDRPVGVVTAVRSSIRAVSKNPMTMFLWGLIVALSLAIGSLPFFAGLTFVIPILGHATWHLYRRVVAH